MMRTWVRFTAIPLLLLLVFAVYSPGLRGGFIFDDYANIVENQNLQVDTLDLATLKKVAMAYAPGEYGRPVATLSFAIDHAIGGTEPLTYKVTSLLVHLLNSLLVMALLLSLFRAAGLAADRKAWWAAFAVALLWAVHPLQVSAVLYVVQRMETLSLTFVLLALLSYLRGRRLQIAGQRGWPWLLACLPLVALGLLTKETAVLFPAYALALELTVLGFGAANPRTQRNWKWLYAAGVVAALLVFVFFAWPRYAHHGNYFMRDFTVGERLLTQLRVLPLYLGQMLLPLSRSLWFYYDNYAPSHSLLNPITTLLGGLLLAGLLALAAWLRKRAPLAALGILWFFAAHLLTSNIIPLELVFEHRNYFALLGVLLVVFDGVRRIHLRDGPTLKYVAVGSVIVGFGFLACIRAATWGDPLLLATEHTHINPGSSRASSDMAAIYFEMADNNPASPFQDFAIREFERGAKLPNSSVVADQGLILVSTGANRKVPDEVWQRLIGKLRNNTIRPETTSTMFKLLENRRKGVALDDKRLTEAFVTFLSRVTLPPNSYAEFGDYVLEFPKDEALADRMFVKAIEESRPYPTYARHVITTLRKRGHERQAKLAEARARELGLLVPASTPSR